MKPDYQSLFESAPGLYLILNPSFKIIAASDTYLSATMTKREEITGRHLFDVFPSNPEDTSANGISNLNASLKFVLKNRSTHTMAVQKYDIRRPDGTFEERFWSPMNKPVLNKKGEVKYIIHRVEDVTDFVRIKNEQDKKDKITDDLRARVEQMEMEIFKRAQEIQHLNKELELQVEERTEKLLDTERQFRKTVDSINEGIQIIDFNWRYVYVNDALVKQALYKREELLGFTMMEKYPGIEQAPFFSVLRNCMIDRVSQRIENEFVFPDNSKGWFELNIHPTNEGIFILSTDITERKKNEQAIINAEANYRELFEKATDAIYVHELDTGRVIEVNQRAVEITGFTKEELLTLSPDEFITNHTDYTLQHAQDKLQKAAKGEPQVFDWLSKKKDGRKNWLEVNLKRATIAGEERILAFFREINDRKKAEEKLNKANRLYAFISQINQNIVHVKEEKPLFKNSCDIAITFGKFKMAWIGIVDTQRQNITLINQSGVPGEDLKLFSNVSYLLNEPQSKVLETGTFFLCNNIHADQELEKWKPFAEKWGIQSCMVLPIRMGGQIIGTFNLYAAELDFFDKEEIALLEEVTGDISFALDIFEKEKLRKKAETSQAKSELNLRTIFENTSSGFLLLDKDFNIISFNKQISHFAVNAFGFDMQPGANFVDMIFPERREPFRKILNDILSGKSYIQEVNYPNRDGSIVWYYSTSSRVLDSTGIPTGLCLTVDNITERKKAESKLELQNKELIKINSELDRFVYSVSHDLRSPLTSILGLVSFIEEESKEDDTLEHARMIRNRVTRLDGFIKNILSYSRNNRIELITQEIPLKKSLLEIVETLKNLPDAKGIRFDLDIEETSPLLTDPVRLNTVLENLISNAIKYQDNNKSDRFIKLKGKVDKTKFILSVEDNGIGIEKEHLPKIFDMFYRISGKVPGSGLGLYIVKEITDKLSGTITCTSVPGKGTTFHLALGNRQS